MIIDEPTNSCQAFEKKSLKHKITSSPFVIWIILANLLIYIYTASLSGNFLIMDLSVLTLFGISGQAIAHGAYWTLLSAMFIHQDLIHLSFNMLSLAMIGIVFEKEGGRMNFLFVYFFAGLSTGILSVIFIPYLIHIGASAAIFGVAGATITRQLKSIIFGALFVMFLFALSHPLSFLAHSSGAFFGVIVDRVLLMINTFQKKDQHEMKRQVRVYK